MLKNDDNLNWSDDELLSAYVDGELTTAERTQVEERLQNDPDARQLVEDLQELSRTMHMLPQETVGQDLRAVVLQHGQSTPVTTLATPRRWLWPVAAVAAALLLAVYLPEINEDQQQQLVQGNQQEQQPATDNQVKAKDKHQQREIPQFKARRGDQPEQTGTENIEAEPAIASKALAEESIVEPAQETDARAFADLPAEGSNALELDAPGISKLADSEIANAPAGKAAALSEEAAREARRPSAAAMARDQQELPHAVGRLGNQRARALAKLSTTPPDLQVQVTLTDPEQFAKLLATQKLAFLPTARPQKRDAKASPPDQLAAGQNVPDRLVVVATPAKLKQFLSACADQEVCQRLRIVGDQPLAPKWSQYAIEPHAIEPPRDADNEKRFASSSEPPQRSNRDEGHTNLAAAKDAEQANDYERADGGSAKAAYAEAAPPATISPGSAGRAAAGESAAVETAVPMRVLFILQKAAQKAPAEQ